MGNLRGAFIIAAAVYCIIFASIFIQPGLSLINPVDVVVKPAGERENKPNLATTKSSAPAEEEKKKPAATADAGHLLVDPKQKPATDQAKHSSPPPDNKDDSRPDDQSKSKPKTAPAEQHKHRHRHKKNKEKKQDCSSKLKPKSETKRDVSPSPKRSASPKQARESSSPKTITTAPTMATKKLDDQPSKKTPKSSATTHEKPAKAPASPKRERLPRAAQLSTSEI